jgi:hypothetical protein
VPRLSLDDFHGENSGDVTRTAGAMMFVPDELGWHRQERASVAGWRRRNRQRGPLVWSSGQAVGGF